MTERFGASWGFPVTVFNIQKVKREVVSLAQAVARRKKHIAWRAPVSPGSEIQFYSQSQELGF